MAKKKVLRITGILFSLLIIASVFLPYNTVNNLPLFSLNKTNELLLPIIIIAFGLISAGLYIFNYYSEFPLSTSGAVLFFVIIEAVYAISNKTISEFGIGYYMLVAGSVFLFINTIILLISGIKDSKNKKEESTNNETSDALDRLYSPQYDDTPIYGQPTQTVMQPQQPIIEPVQPVVEPLVEPVPVVEPIVEPVPVVEPQPIIEPVQPVPVAPVDINPYGIQEPVQELSPIMDTQTVVPTVEPLPEIQFEQMQEYKEPITPLYDEPKEVKPEDNPALRSLLEPSVQPVNPVVNQFEQQPVNPVVNQFEQQPLNPVVNQFEQQPVSPVVNQFEQQPVSPVVNQFEQQPVNPVVNQFEQQPVNPVLSQFEQPLSFIGQPVQPQPSVQPQQQPTQGIGMDIFNNH